MAEENHAHSQHGRAKGLGVSTRIKEECEGEGEGMKRDEREWKGMKGMEGTDETGWKGMKEDERDERKWNMRSKVKVDSQEDQLCIFFFLIQSGKNKNV